MKLREQYEFVNPKSNREMSHIRIIAGKYDGVEYGYGNVAPKIINGEPIISYIFEVYKNPTKYDLDNDKQFKNLISDILHEVLQKAFS